jgi:hypothetical protein
MLCGTFFHSFQRRHGGRPNGSVRGLGPHSEKASIPSITQCPDRSQGGGAKRLGTANQNSSFRQNGFDIQAGAHLQGAHSTAIPIRGILYYN